MLTLTGLNPDVLSDVEANLKATIGLAMSMLALCLITGAMRLYVRLRILKMFAVDDWAMVIAQIFFAITAILFTITSLMGQDIMRGKPLPISLHAYLMLSKWDYACYVVTAVVIKISLAIFLLRIFTNYHIWERIIIVILSSISSLLGLASFFIVLTSCALSISEKCPHAKTFQYLGMAFSIVNALADITFALLAFFVLWKMTMDRTSKLSAFVVLAIGATGGIASLLRVVIFFERSDVTLRLLRYSQYSIIEAGAIIIATCLFTVRPLLSLFGWRVKTVPRAQGTPWAVSTRVLREGLVAELNDHGLIDYSPEGGSREKLSAAEEVRERQESTSVV